MLFVGYTWDKENHERSKEVEGLGSVLSQLPWWMLKLIFILVGILILWAVSWEFRNVLL